MITIHSVEQGTDEWHKLRRGKVTASNAHKLLQFGKSRALEESSFKGNYHTERGKDLEKYAIDQYEKSNLIDVQRIGFVTNDTYPDCGASPDGITDRLIEVKCFKDSKHLSITWKTIPFEVQAQIQFGMMICELDKCDLVLYNPEVDPRMALRVITVKAVKKVHQNIRRALK